MRTSYLAAGILACLSGSALAADPGGDWLVADGRAVVRIEPCGDALCGIVARTNDPGTDPSHTASTKRDPSVGVTILQDMKATAPDRWDGHAYNPENGKTYAAYMTLKSPNVLRIDGCVLGGLACGGENWKRVRCEEGATGRTSGAGTARTAAPDKSVRKVVTSCHVADP